MHKRVTNYLQFMLNHCFIHHYGILCAKPRDFETLRHNDGKKTKLFLYDADTYETYNTEKFNNFFISSPSIKLEFFV